MTRSVLGLAHIPVRRKPALPRGTPSELALMADTGGRRARVQCARRQCQSRQSRRTPGAASAGALSVPLLIESDTMRSKATHSASLRC